MNDKSIENATHEVAADHLKMAGNSVTLVVQQQVSAWFFAEIVAKFLAFKLFKI